MRLIKTADGSYTLKNYNYLECYHSKEGAIKESLYKHIFPAFEAAKNIDKPYLTILDICFGLGYNSLYSILHAPKPLKIYSPEIDLDLIKSLKNFPYPKEVDKIKHIIQALSTNLHYKDSKIEINIIVNDAKEYIKNINFEVDIVYQDPFSPPKNPTLWDKEYFSYIKRVINPKGVITTYSVAKRVRKTLKELGFNIYTHPYNNIRKGTIASLSKLNFKEI